MVRSLLNRGLVSPRVTAFREILDGGRVKGGMLRAHLQWVAEHHIPGGLEEIRGRVSTETARTLCAPILSIGWYPFRAVVETDRAIAALVPKREEKTTIADLGRYSARINLTTSYRVYAKARPHDFFHAAAQLHGHFQDFGRAEYEPKGSTACRISLWDYACFSKVYCWSALGYYEQATALQGGRDVQVTETECLCEGGRVCCFEIVWS